MNKLTKGFSLIELMVVIAIIAILAAIATPLYSNYKERASMIDAVSSIGAIKAEIENDINNGVDISQQNYMVPTGISIVNASSSGATIQINMNERSPDVFDNANDTLRLTGITSNNTFRWSCSHNANAVNLTTSNVPTTCQDTF